MARVEAAEPLHLDLICCQRYLIQNRGRPSTYPSGPVVMKCPETGREILRYGELDRSAGMTQEYVTKPDDFTMSVDELHVYLMKFIEDHKNLQVMKDDWSEFEAKLYDPNVFFVTEGGGILPSENDQRLLKLTC